MPLSLADPAVQAVVSAAKKKTARMHPSPAAWRDQVFYSLMIDRFDNPAAPPRYQPWNAPYNSFQGGSYAGVKARLRYLKKLGVTALWLLPPLKNCQFDPDTYHGYGIQDFMAAEPRFADDPARADDELRALVDAAHAEGLYVVFDIVLHHAGNVFAYPGQGKRGRATERDAAGWSDEPMPIYWRDERGRARADWPELPADAPADAGVWPKELQRNDYFQRQGAFDNDARPTADFYSMKSLNTEYRDATGARPVYDALLQAYQYVIARYDIDGFRIDTLKFMSRELEWAFAGGIRDYARAVGKKGFFLFGEIWDSEEAISDRLRPRQGEAGGSGSGVDGVQDYPLFYKLADVIKGGASPKELAAVFAEREKTAQSGLPRGRDARDSFVTFLDNHDASARFGWMGENQECEQIVAGLGALMCLQGIPCLYYGTEQGLQGHKDAREQSDSCVREALWGKPDAFDTRHPLYKAVAELAALRAGEEALRSGGQFFRPVSGDGREFRVSERAPGVLVFSRVWQGGEIVYAANLAPDGPDFEGWAVIDGGISAAGATYELLYANKPRVRRYSSGVVEARAKGEARITDGGGTSVDGPVSVLPLRLRPREMQILRSRGG